MAVGHGATRWARLWVMLGMLGSAVSWGSGAAVYAVLDGGWGPGKCGCGWGLMFGGVGDDAGGTLGGPAAGTRKSDRTQAL